MIRGSIKKHLIGLNPDFRNRGEEPGRLENFSDAVFALAVTLLLISTSAPNNFEHIKLFVWELIPFTLCIVIIVLIWFEHFTFFFRYGLRNPRIIVLNTIFLVIVLFYVYPLKFLTKLALWPIAIIFKQDALIQNLKGMIRGEDMADLMIIFGLGYFAVFFILMLMYRYAVGKAEELQLNKIELFDTRTKVNTNLLMSTIPIVSVLVAVIMHNQRLAGMYAGFVYFLYTPVMITYGIRVDKKRKSLLREIESEQHAGEE